LANHLPEKQNVRYTTNIKLIMFFAFGKFFSGRFTQNFRAWNFEDARMRNFAVGEKRNLTCLPYKQKPPKIARRVAKDKRIWQS
jgi:hypothetical protein